MCGYVAQPFKGGTDCTYNEQVDKGGENPAGKERIKNLDTDALIEEFKDKKSGNVALVRKEMQNRFMENKDCDKIAEAFNASVEKDKQWVKSHEKKRKEEQ